MIEEEPLTRKEKLGNIGVFILLAVVFISVIGSWCWGFIEVRKEKENERAAFEATAFKFDAVPIDSKEIAFKKSMQEWFIVVQGVRYKVVEKIYETVNVGDFVSADGHENEIENLIIQVKQ